MPTGTKAGDLGGLKRTLRDRIRLLKEHATQAELEEKSLRIQKLLFSTPEFKSAGTILLYASIKGEVRTGGMITEALRLGKKILLPKIEGEKLELYAIKGLVGLEKNSLGIPEPKKGLPEPLASVGLLVLPGIAFDRTGNRLGRGKGYYDRLLAESGGRIPKIALAFQFQIVGQVPVGNMDQKVDKIITEEGAIDCTGRNQRTGVDQCQK